MNIITRWMLPVACVVLGVAVMTGALLTELPDNTLLRPVMGIVIIMLGVHRFVVSRIHVKPKDRRFGGDRSRPWEKE